MRRPLAAPPRLLALRPQDDPAGMARLVRSTMRGPRDPVPRLKGRIRSTLRRRSAWRRRCMRAAIIGSLVLLAGGVVGAVVQPVVRARLQLEMASVENVYPSGGRPHGQRRRAGSAAPSSADQGTGWREENTELPALVPSAPAAESPSESSESPRMAPTAERPQVLAPVAGPVRAPGRARTMAAAFAARPSSAAQPRSVAPMGAPMGPVAPPVGQREVPALVAFEPPPVAWKSAETLPDLERPTTAGPSTVTPSLPAAGSSGSPGAAPSAYPSAVATLASPPPRPATGVASGARAAGPSEQELLFRAVRSLRAEHRPESALLALDEYAARFRHGSLAPEAARLRTEVLLALGEKPAALAELDRDLASGSAGGEEHRLVRGELHALAGRWKEALQDFDAVVLVRLAHATAAGPPPSAKLRDHLERALWGRASARSHVGDSPGATSDLREYLRLFPEGRFAAQAARLLAEPR